MKKTIVFIALLLVSSVTSFAQKSEKVEVGDIFTISAVEGNKYQYVKFPKSNFIIKKGGIVNYTRIVGEKVKVTSVKEKKGTKVATLELVSGKKFFNSHKSIKAMISEALKNNELSK